MRGILFSLVLSQSLPNPLQAFGKKIRFLLHQTGGLTLQSGLVLEEKQMVWQSDKARP